MYYREEEKYEMDCLVSEIETEYDCIFYYDTDTYDFFDMKDDKIYKSLFFIYSYDSEGLAEFLSEKYQEFLDEESDYISSNFMSISTTEVFQPFSEEHFCEIEQTKEQIWT